MKVIKIFAMPSHTFIDKISGVDYARIIQPMKYLHGYKDEDVEFQVKVYDHSKNESFDWRDIFAEYDAVYFNYTTNDVGYAVMGTLAQKYNRKLICDFDDDLWNILPDNPAYDVFKSDSWGRKVVTAVVNDVSHVTVTNRHLRHAIEFNTKKSGDNMTILPNYIDLSLYKHRCKFKDRGYYRALYFGSSTHFSDMYSPPFVEAMDRVMKDYPNFSFMSIGVFVPKFRDMWGSRYEQGFGHTDLLKWIDKMPEFMDNSDFMIVPLVNNTYNRSKSSIKYLESSSFKIPGAFQNIRQYQEVIKQGENGFLCSTAQEWYDAITKLINDSKLRQNMGEAAYKTIEDWQIQRHINTYSEMFKKILTNE